MIVVRVGLTVRPTDRQALIDHMRSEAVQVRLLDGCLRFDFLQDIVGENTFVLYEEWSDQENFDLYRGSSFFAENGEKVFAFLDGAPDAAYYAATPPA